MGPSPGEGATMNIFKNGTYAAVLIGGTNGTANVHIFQFDNKTWIPLAVPGLPDLAYHTASITAANNVIIFGGEDLSSHHASGKTYVLAVDSTSANSSNPHFNSTTPSPRTRHGAVYAHNRMLLYGGDYATGEGPSSMWQLAVEGECSMWSSCGECLLADCFWCRPNGTYFCVAGFEAPYIPTTCTSSGWNSTNIVCCRRAHPTSTALVAATVVILVAIAILVIATYIVDWKKGKATGGGYEPIMGI